MKSRGPASRLRGGGGHCGEHTYTCGTYKETLWTVSPPGCVTCDGSTSTTIFVGCGVRVWGVDGGRVLLPYHGLEEEMLLERRCSYFMDLDTPFHAQRKDGHPKSPLYPSREVSRLHGTEVARIIGQGPGRGGRGELLTYRVGCGFLGLSKAFFWR